MIPFAQYAPDQAALGNPASRIARGVLPRTVSSYGPLATLAAVADALAAAPRGAFTARQADGNPKTFAATTANLYSLAGTSWNEVSKTTGAYSLPADEFAEMAQFGLRVVAAMGIATPVQSFTLGTSSAFADLSGDAPYARHVAVVRDFVMLGNTFDATDSDQPQRVWWSAINNPASWPTPGTVAAAQVQSDFQDLPIGGWVQRIVPAIGGADAAIFMEKAIYRAVYTGPPTVFAFEVVEKDRGTPAPGSVVNVGPLAFFLGEDGFYVFDGAASRPIGNQRVDKTFYQDLNESFVAQVHGAADAINKLVFWAYPSGDSADGVPDKLIIYNWALDRWSHADLDLTLLFTDLSQGFTLEQLDAFGSLDSLPASLDSRMWTGGRLLLSAFDADRRLSRFTGAAMDAVIETEETGGPQRLFVSGIRPYVDGGTVTVALRTRDTPGGALTDTAESGVDADGQAHFGTSARFARARVTIAAGGTWSHAQGIDITAQPDGGL